MEVGAIPRPLMRPPLTPVPAHLRRQSYRLASSWLVTCASGRRLSRRHLAGMPMLAAYIRCPARANALSHAVTAHGMSVVAATIRPQGRAAATAHGTTMSIAVL